MDLLQWWSAQSNSPLYSVVKEDNKYWLKSPLFGRHTDEHSVLAEAKELIPIIKGSAIVRGMDMRSIGVAGRVVVGGQRSVICEIESSIDKFMAWKENDIFYRKINDRIYEVSPPFSQDFLMCIEGMTLELDERIKKGLQIDSYLHQLEKRIDDPYIYDTFSYFVEEPPSWLSLWKTFEMIKFDVDRNLNRDYTIENCAIVSKEWAEKGEFDDFEETANNYLAEAKPRHSQAYSLNEERKRKTSNPIKEQKHEERKKKHEADHPPMRLGTAAGLIWRIFRGWCKWKACIC